jgi:CRISPR system Cascade subunit CasC
MKIELHILQNFAPSNLNRDDTGAPKDCELGGYRRARISSQCLKRAVRDAFKVDGAFGPDDLAVRTKRLVENVADRLVSDHGRDHERAINLVAAALGGAGLKVKTAAEDHKTEYLLFLPRRHLDRLAGLVNKHWDTLAALAFAETEPEGTERDATRSRKKQKADKKGAFPKEIAEELLPILEDAAHTPDLALFGRMIADRPEWNVDAACQVAHAISTNRVAMEFDFYTAVDDLRPADTAGSDMMGTVQFNSSCFYRYSVLDVDDLRRNLGAENDLVNKTATAYLRASVLAVPTGKQNNMAAHNPPSFVLAVVRPSGIPVSLANAFVQPVRSRGDADLITASIDALMNHLQSVYRMFGLPETAAFYIADRAVTAPEGPARFENKNDLPTLLAAVESKISGAAA